MAHLLANLAFNTEIRAAIAHQMTKAAESMTYRVRSARCGDFSMPGTEFLTCASDTESTAPSVSRIVHRQTHTEVPDDLEPLELARPMGGVARALLDRPGGVG